jgi:hypothetical protein
MPSATKRVNRYRLAFNGLRHGRQLMVFVNSNNSEGRQLVFGVNVEGSESKFQMQILSERELRQIAATGAALFGRSRLKELVRVAEPPLSLQKKKPGGSRALVRGCPKCGEEGVTEIGGWHYIGAGQGRVMVFPTNRLCPGKPSKISKR